KEEYDSAVQQDKDTTTYVYDYENRLTEIVHADSSTSEYTYDGAGKRIKTVEKNSQGTVTSTTKFLYDGLNVVIERNVSDETTAAYTRGLSYGGGIGGIISKKTSATTNYFHYDGIGTVTGLTDANESVVQTYIYEAYGNLLYSTGSEANNHQFSTKEHSANSGLSYFGARYYDPRIGRWTQKDPWGMIDGPNVYLYVNNNPVNWIDYWGFCKKSLGTSDSEVPNPTELAKFIPIVGTVGAVPTLASISWVPVIGWGVGGGLAVRKGLSYANKLYITNIHRQIIRDYFRAAAIVNKRYGSIVAAPEKIRKSLTYLRIDAMRSLQQIAGNVGEIPYKEISGAATGAGK
ncbi:hypothetical protein KAI19_05490, partial [bacterium]|nr:hypothetical protein [bacterium]